MPRREQLGARHPRLIVLEQLCAQRARRVLNCSASDGPWMATSHVSFKSPNARIQRPANGKRSGAVCRSAGMTGSASFLLRWLFQEVLHFADQMHSVLLIGHEVRALGKHDHAAVLCGGAAPAE